MKLKKIYSKYRLRKRKRIRPTNLKKMKTLLILLLQLREEKVLRRRIASY
jgi:hypothetical protein